MSMAIPQLYVGAIEMYMIKERDYPRLGVAHQEPELLPLLRAPPQSVAGLLPESGLCLEMSLGVLVSASGWYGLSSGRLADHWVPHCGCVTVGPLQVVPAAGGAAKAMLPVVLQLHRCFSPSLAWPHVSADGQRSSPSADARMGGRFPRQVLDATGGSTAASRRCMPEDGLLSGNRELFPRCHLSNSAARRTASPLRGMYLAPTTPLSGTPS